ncbi:MAG TPA: hypothetical protein VEK06_03255, partial [Myxococcota bacterium]|nr:hypothetical protein [Myxococcota bacterium]
KQYRIATKSAKTTIVLKDQQTGVIGGLIHHKSTKSDNKIPFLGDIPLLGWLFKTRESSDERKSLVLILTPYIIRDESDYEQILKKKLREREEFAEMYFGGKIKNYNKSINYDKKAGPISNMLLSLESEMSKVENGGPGDGSETVIVPQEKGKEKSKETAKETPKTPIIESPKEEEQFFAPEPVFAPAIETPASPVPPLGPPPPMLNPTHSPAEELLPEEGENKGPTGSYKDSDQVTMFENKEDEEVEVVPEPLHE